MSLPDQEDHAALTEPATQLDPAKEHASIGDAGDTSPIEVTPRSATHLRSMVDEKALPREKVDAYGFEALSDAELLALLFGTGAQGFNVMEMSKALLKSTGDSLINMARIPWEEFTKTKGIGHAKAKHLGGVFELAKRIARETAADIVLDQPERIARFIGPEMRAEGREVVKVILLNTRLRFIGIEMIAQGSINECTVTAALVLRPAIVRQAYGFVLVHNHPSGDFQPSTADRQFTRKLITACAAVGIHCLDHLIIGQPAHPGDPDYYSFRENGFFQTGI